jgi:hypothetical protein
MATQFKEDFHETRSERLVVLVSPTEKRAIEARARSAKLSLSDFVRASAQNYEEPTEAEMALLSDLLHRIDETDTRIDATFARIDAMRANEAAFDEDAYKAELTTRWTRPDGAPDWELMQADLAQRTRLS